ncbi:PQQ enzyme repeat protein [compost metagenome]
MIVEDIIYFGTAYTDKSALMVDVDAFYAVDLNTGEEKWRFEGNHSPILSTPVVADGVVFFTALDGTVYALH